MYIATFILPTVIAITTTIRTTHDVSTKIANNAKATCPPVKHFTVPSTYHLYSAENIHIITYTSTISSKYTNPIN